MKQLSYLTELVSTVYSKYLIKKSVTSDDLNTLINTQELLLSNYKEIAPSSTWDTIARLYDLTNETEKLVSLGEVLVELDIGGEELITRFLNALKRKKSLDDVEKVFNKLSKHQKKYDNVVAFRIRLLYEKKEYNRIVTELGDFVLSKTCPSDIKGYYVNALLLSGSTETALDFYLDKVDPMDFPDWSFIKLFNSTKSEAKLKPKHYSAVQRHLNSKSDIDRLIWECRIAEMSSNWSVAENLAITGRNNFPDRKEFEDIFLQIVIKSRQWFKYHDLICSDKIAASVVNSLGSDLLIARDCISELIKYASSHGLILSELKYPDAIYNYILESKAPLYHPEKRTLLHVTNSLGPGGAERVLSQLYNGIEEREDFDQHIAVASLDRNRGHDFYLDSLNISEDDLILMDYDKEIPAPFSWLPKSRAKNSYNIYRIIKTLKPEIIHSWQDGMNIDVAFAASLAGARKVILHTHNMRPDLVHDTPIAPSFRNIYKAIINSTNMKLIFVSCASQYDYSNWLGIKNSSNDRLNVIYNGFQYRLQDQKERSKSRIKYRNYLSIPLESFVVGTAIRFSRIKRPELWFEVASQLVIKVPNIKFVMFGDGELKESIEKKIDENNLGQNFILPGRIDKLLEQLPLMDVFMLTSESEGLPTVLIEAQLCKIPVVSNLRGGAAECIIENKTGILVDSDDPIDYVKAIIKIKNNHSFKNELIAQTTNKFLEKFSRSSMVDQVIKLYNSDE